MAGWSQALQSGGIDVDVDGLHHMCIFRQSNIIICPAKPWP